LIGLNYVKTVLGNSTTITFDGALSTDRLWLQFFDENCYGSELVGCPGPPCLSVVDLQVCQDIYGTPSRAFLLRGANAVGYTSYEIYLDGSKIDEIAGDRGLFYVDNLSPGSHSFGIRGICGSDLTEIVSRDFTILTSSPHSNPAIHLHCTFDPEKVALVGTWLPGDPSDFIDVYIRHPGDTLLDFVGTIPGHRTRVKVKNVTMDDQIVLQFFNESCYGSPLISCGKNDTGSGNFLRG